MPSAPAEALASRYGEYFARDPEVVARDLDVLAQMLEKWNKAKNLVSRETVASLWERHIADSLQLLKYVRATDRLIVDLGSGGGFPALPLAIALKSKSCRIVMIEPVRGKSSFLKAVARELELDARIIGTRSDDIDVNEIGVVDVITSRALAALPRLLGLAEPFWQKSTRGLFHKGREHVEELSEADSLWLYNVVHHPSDTSPDGVILEISSLRRR